MTTPITITVTIAGHTVAILVTSDGITTAPDTPVAAAPVASASSRTPVKSSVIASVGYNVIHRTLEIEFVGGDVYQYASVPSYVYDELMDTRSVGQYFSHYIRDKYTTRKLTR